MNNRILENFKKGKPTLGTITHLGNSAAVECIGAAGLDYVLIDMEHAPLDRRDAAACIMAADAAGITPIVRIPDIQRSMILNLLDVGARGLIVPNIESVEQVRQLIDYAKFKPLGSRGYCMTRDGKWGFGEDYEAGMTGYMANCNSSTMLLPQCETVECLEHIEEIVALDGIDGILIGPFDLSIAMGLDGQFDHPAFQQAVERVRTACQAQGKLSMIFAASEADISKRLAQGFDSILYGLDALALTSYYRNAAEVFAFHAVPNSCQQSK